jgi:hypothetical protein
MVAEEIPSHASLSALYPRIYWEYKLLKHPCSFKPRLGKDMIFDYGFKPVNMVVIDSAVGPFGLCEIVGFWESRSFMIESHSGDDGPRKMTIWRAVEYMLPIWRTCWLQSSTSFWSMQTPSAHARSTLWLSRMWRRAQSREAVMESLCPSTTIIRLSFGSPHTYESAY